MGEYDITKAFKKIEDDLIASMVRNLERHKTEETLQGMNWSMWQVEQLKSLEKYKFDNSKKYGKEFKVQNKRIEELIRLSKSEGGLEQETKILEAIQKGFTGRRQMLSGNFFRLNERKLETLINATTNDMKKAETAVLRMSNDKYRQVIFNAQMYANSGTGTYQKAVDMATKDMLSAGLNCVEYKNGARHTLPDYAEMAIRTANKRAYLQGEGEKRQEWGISTVIMNKRGNPCPRCLPFCGKVLIDDVWSGGKSSDGDYPLMSAAIEKGLYHPRCKDSHSTFFPDVSTEDSKWTREELNSIKAENVKDEKKQYAKRQVNKFERLAKYSLDEQNKSGYQRKASKWKGLNNKYNSFEELDNSMNKRYNASVDADVRNLNIEQVSKTMEEFEQVISDFPKIADSFTGINTASFGKAAFLPNGELTLNPKYYRKINQKIIGTGYHEAGHLIELYLIKRNNPAAHIDEICELYAKGTNTSNIVNKAIRSIKSNKSRMELIEEISMYALKNDSETVAEAIKDYYKNGYLATLLSRQIIKVLKEELK